MYIYLDESGDMGFNFETSRSSNVFTITLLVCHTKEAVNTINKACVRTLKNKIHTKSNYKNIQELKGTGLIHNTKKYFLRNAVKSEAWDVYAIILDKKHELSKLTQPINIHRIYNIMANHLIRQVDFSDVGRVNLFVDKSKNAAGIKEFDTMLQVSLDTVLPLNISHVASHKSRGIQAADLFCWGIYRYYEQQDRQWYDEFQHKIMYEENFIL